MRGDFLSPHHPAFFFFEEIPGDDEDPICASSLCAGSAEEHQGREQALNLAVTLELLASSRSPSGLSALLRIRVSVK